VHSSLEQFREAVIHSRKVETAAGDCFKKSLVSESMNEKEMRWKVSAVLVQVLI
jgi:hypothetical protein